MRRALSALLAVVAAAVAVAGCGDSGSSNTVPSKAEYKQEFTKLSEQLSAVGAAVGVAINKSSGKSNKALEKTFADLADRTRAVAQKIDDTTPPDDANIQKQQAALVAGLNTAADDLDAISKAAGKKDLRAAGTAAGKLTRDNAAIANPRIALNKALYGTGGGTPAQTTTTTTTTTTTP